MDGSAPSLSVDSRGRTMVATTTREPSSSAHAAAREATSSSGDASGGSAKASATQKLCSSMTWRAAVAEEAYRAQTGATGADSEVATRRPAAGFRGRVGLPKRLSSGLDDVALDRGGSRAPPRGPGAGARSVLLGRPPVAAASRIARQHLIKCQQRRGRAGMPDGGCARRAPSAHVPRRRVW